MSKAATVVRGHRKHCNVRGWEETNVRELWTGNSQHQGDAFLFVY